MGKPSATLATARRAKRPGLCAHCGQVISPGDLIVNTGSGYVHLSHIPGGGR